MKRNLNKIYVFAFLFLYLLVAAISFCHAIEFFSIGNVQWMSITLAFAFELGLFVCLSSILLGTNKDNTIAWLLLTILVIVQVCGNTYSVFKYISESETEYYQYLAKPLLFWIEEVSEETVQIIISWIMGAILPIVALLMTEMVSKTIKGDSTEGNVDIQTDIKDDEEDALFDDEYQDGDNADVNEINNSDSDNRVDDNDNNNGGEEILLQPESKKENQTTQNNSAMVAHGDLGKTKEMFMR